MLAATVTKQLPAGASFKELLLSLRNSQLGAARAAAARIASPVIGYSLLENGPSVGIKVPRYVPSLTPL